MRLGCSATLSWDYLKKNLVLARVQSLMWPLMFLLVGFSLIITLYFGGMRVIDGRLSIGTLDGVLRVPYHAHLADDRVRLGHQYSAAGRSVDGSPGKDHGYRARDQGHGCDRPSDRIHLAGPSSSVNVGFHHKNASRPALLDIVLSIPAGATIAVVGYTGSGKSTLVNLLPRLYDVTQGEILLDGVNIQHIPLQVLRSHIGYVPQETFLFSETIADNIAYGTEGQSDQHIREAADISQLAHDVAEFPQGFQPCWVNAALRSRADRSSGRALPGRSCGSRIS